MRFDVLEAFAEATPGGIKLGKLAQLPSNFDGDRPKLDGVGFEFRESKKAKRLRLRDGEISRLMKLRSRRRRPGVYRAASRVYEAAHREQVNAKARRQHVKHRAANLARMKARRAANREAENAKSLARYHANAEEQKARMRAYYAANREMLLAKAKARNAAKKARKE